jgi:hypothetical protein
VNDPAVDSRTKFEQFRAKPQFDVWRISQQQAFKIFDAGWQAGREELTRQIADKLQALACEEGYIDIPVDTLLQELARLNALIGEKP